MTRKDKAVSIIEKLVEICNEGTPEELAECQPVISFGPDWGGYRLTIWGEDGRHTHVGNPANENIGTLIDSLYNTLVVGKGLSWE